MRIERRIAKLEQSVVIPPPNCPECGYPGRANQTIPVTDHSDPLPEYERCQQPLDETGMPYVTPLYRIILHKN